MTRTVLSSLLFICFFFTFHISGYTQDISLRLNGKWEDENLNMIYELNPDGTIMFYQSGNGVLINSYTLDLSKDPAWIDFTIQMGSQKMVIMSLLKVIDENTIWIEQGSSYGDHPTEFSDPNTEGKYKIHILKKVISK